VRAGHKEITRPISLAIMMPNSRGYLLQYMDYVIRQEHCYSPRYVKFVLPIKQLLIYLFHASFSFSFIFAALAFRLVIAGGLDYLIGIVEASSPFPKSILQIRRLFTATQKFPFPEHPHCGNVQDSLQ
jgi:hypothetical protein